MRGYGNLLITVANSVIQDLNANFYNVLHINPFVECRQQIKTIAEFIS